MKYLHSLWLMLMASIAVAQPLQLTDMAGRTVALPNHADRIVATYMPATLLSLSLNLGDNLVGIPTQSGRKSLVTDLLGDRIPTQIGSRSAGINLESVLALKPDLVLISDKKDGARLAEQLQQLGIPSMLMRVESMQQIEQALTLIATAAGQPQQAERVINANLTLKKELQQQLDGVQPIRGYYGNGGDLYRSVGSTMFQHQLLTLAGINNVAADVPGFYPKINLEQLLSWAPNYLVLEQSRRGERLSKQLAEPQLSWLAELPQTTLPSHAMWHMPTPVAMAGAYYLASKVHPQRFKGIDVEARISQFYQQALGDKCLSPLASKPCR